MPPSTRVSPAASVNRPPASSTIGWIAARSQIFDPHGVHGAVDRAFCDQHVGPEVAVAPRVPGVPRERRDRLLEREREHGILDLAYCRDADAIVVDPGPSSPLGVPAAMERRRRDDTEQDLPVLLQRDQGRPHRDPPRVVARAVDRVDDPASAAACRGAELLPEQPVVGTLFREPLSDRRLDGTVGLGHGRQVGLRLDVQIPGAEAPERDRVRRVGEREGQCKVGAHRAPTLLIRRPTLRRRRGGTSASPPRAGAAATTS